MIGAAQIAEALEALAYLSDLHPDDAHDGVLIGARWYPRWRLEELADKHREPAGGDA